MDINSAISQLANAISNTPEFIQFKNLRNQVNQDSKLAPLLSQFEEKEKQLYSSQNPQQLMAELDKDFNNLNAIPLLKQFFTAQERVNQITQQVMQNLNMELDKRL